VNEQLKNPNTLFLMLQIAIGACMLFFGSRMANVRESKQDRRPTESAGSSATRCCRSGSVTPPGRNTWLTETHRRSALEDADGRLVECFSEPFEFCSTEG